MIERPNDHNRNRGLSQGNKALSLWTFVAQDLESSSSTGPDKVLLGCEKGFRDHKYISSFLLVFISTRLEAVTMSEPSWAKDNGRASISRDASKKIAGTGQGSDAVMDEVADRTAVISNRLKTIYKKSVETVEKRYRYDYFYESPYLTDVEFDGKLQFMFLSLLLIT